jgi:hypothetical protein
MANAEPASPAEGHAGWVVRVRDVVNAELAEHPGADYVSPPQAREHALALVALLLGGAPPPNGAVTWTHAVAGGRRTISLTPATPAEKTPALTLTPHS